MYIKFKVNSLITLLINSLLLMTDHVSVGAGSDPVTEQVMLTLSPGAAWPGAGLRVGPRGIAAIILLILVVFYELTTDTQHIDTDLQQTISQLWSRCQSLETRCWPRICRCLHSPDWCCTTWHSSSHCCSSEYREYQSRHFKHKDQKKAFHVKSLLKSNL